MNSTGAAGLMRTLLGPTGSHFYCVKSMMSSWQFHSTEMYG
jgi:hypothetical protein